MEITNQAQALQFIAAWRADLRAGNYAAGHKGCARAFRGAANSMTRCAAICRSQGRTVMQADYETAHEVLRVAAEYHEQESAREEREWAEQQATLVRAEEARISELRRKMGLS